MSAAPHRLRLPPGALLAIAGFSLGANLLLLTGPYFLLQIYDRVFPSRSHGMLVALLLLVLMLYAAMAVFDVVRSRLGARIGARLQTACDLAVFRAELGGGAAADAADVACVRRFWASPLALALFDLPFTPLFLAGIFLLHPLLGAVALAGSLLLVAVAWGNRLSRLSLKDHADAETRRATALATEMHRGEDVLRALGMTAALAARWRGHRAGAQSAELAMADRNAAFVSASRSFRLFLQSALLAAGAWLVLEGALSAGIILALTVMLGRALAPVETLIGNWDGIARARASWLALTSFEAAEPAARPAPATLLVPRVEVEGAACGPSADRLTVTGLTFTLKPGQALAIAGPSGAGKSSVARMLTGIWPVRAGAVRLGGHALVAFPAETLAAHVGYLPQDVVLFEGTVAENIARFAPDADPQAILEAAVAAGIEGMILRLPEGYETQVGRGGRNLSGGQRQRIGLARALCGNPALVVFDEPDASLDEAGSAAVVRAIRAARDRGAAVVVIAHRPEAIAACDRMLRLRDGKVEYFGPNAATDARALAHVS